MKKISNFYNFIKKKVQSDWFEKNLYFYLSTTKKEIQKEKEDKKSKLVSNKKLKQELKNTPINNIQFIKYNNYFENEYINVLFTHNSDNHYFFTENKYLEEQNYKFILALFEQLIRQHELTNHRTYKYDKKLMKYIQ